MSANVTQPHIGAFVLETLTTGMYTNPLDSLREYVQNAHDSIQSTIRSQGLKPGAGRIDVTIDTKKREVRIKDNGAGIPTADASARLINIGMSTKRLSEDAGFRGIGRLAGIAYCDKLRFITQAAGESQLTEVVFQCTELRKSMSPSKRQTDELVDVLGKHTEITKRRTMTNSSSFEVVMEGISEEGSLFLDWERIHTFLSQVAPVKFDTSSFGYAPEIYSWAKTHGLTMPEVSVLLKSEKVSLEVFKPFKRITYKTNRDLDIRIRGIRFFPEDASSHSQYWGWYADSNLPGMYADGNVAGIRLRKSNIALGLNERMTEIFAEVSDSNSRFNSYLIGEVHVLNPQVVPNAHRDGFEDSPHWASIRRDLIDFARERSREIRDASTSRNIDTEKLLQPINGQIKLVQQKVVTGLASQVERDGLVNKLDKCIQKLSSVNDDGRSADDLKRIGETKKKVEAAKTAVLKAHYVTEGLKTSLDKKQRKVITEIMEILHTVLEPEQFDKAREAIMDRFGVNHTDEE